MSPGLLVFGAATLLPVAILLGVLLSKKSGAPPERPLAALGLSLIPVFAVAFLAFIALIAKNPVLRMAFYVAEIVCCWHIFDRRRSRGSGCPRRKLLADPSTVHRHRPIAHRSTPTAHRPPRQR